MTRETSLSLLAVVFVLAACSPAETSRSTVSGSVPTTTSTAATSTTLPPTTTLAPSTTLPRTTTTTVPPTTTTLLDGVWSDQPLMVTGSWVGVLGWWDGSAWVSPTDFSAIEVPPGTSFQTLAVGDSSVTESTGVVETCEWIDAGDFLVEMVDSTTFTEVAGEEYESVAISAPWRVAPHAIEILSDDGTYSGFAGEVLAGLGVPEENPIIKQVVSLDLEGDGVLEKLVVAENSTVDFEPSEGYSVVFMRRLVDGDVHTSVVASHVEGGIHTAVSGIGDLNGDGTMEVVVASHGWESSGVSLFELSGDELGIVLQAGCGV